MAILVEGFVGVDFVSVLDAGTLSNSRLVSSFTGTPSISFTEKLGSVDMRTMATSSSSGFMRCNVGARIVGSSAHYQNVSHICSTRKLKLIP